MVRREGPFWRSAVCLALVVLGVMVVAALWPRAWLPHDPDSAEITQRLLPPGWLAGGTAEHPLGTDHIGRDLLSRLVYASRYTLVIAVAAVAIAAVLGTIAGIVAGFFGGFVDTVISRLIDIQLALPAIILLIALVAVFGSKTEYLIAVLGISGWAGFARVVRSSALVLRHEQFTVAARGMGSSSLRTMRRHILPNLASVVLVYISIDLARVVLLESSLSFLGLGVAPPGVTWGSVVAEGRSYLLDSWWLSAVPGLLIVAFIVALNALGDSYSDLLDPRGGHRDRL